jgi:hypothetical protein
VSDRLVCVSVTRAIRGRELVKRVTFGDWWSRRSGGLSSSVHLQEGRTVKLPRALGPKSLYDIDVPTYLSVHVKYTYSNSSPCSPCTLKAMA